MKLASQVKKEAPSQGEMMAANFSPPLRLAGDFRALWLSAGGLVVVVAEIIVLPGLGVPPWVLMWTLALTMGLGCKWLTWAVDGRDQNAGAARNLGYLLA